MASKANAYVTLDQIDKLLLNALQDDASLSVSTLADRCGVSAPSCYRRIRRLRKSGVIEREVALLRLPDAQAQITVAFEVTLERQTRPQQTAFQLKMNKHPEVRQCYVVAGETDYLVIAQFKDMAAYETFSTDILSADRNMKKYRSLIASRCTKFSTKVVL